MVGLNSLVEIAKRAMQTSQFNLNVIGHNIANADRTDYSRQRAEISASYPLQFPQGAIGTGVNVDGVYRQRDQYLDLKIREEFNTYGQWSYREKTLSQIESIFNEPSEYGLSTLINKFWDGWQDLMNDPENVSVRTTLRHRSVQMTSQFNQLHSQLRSYQQTLNTDLTLLVDKINSLAANIANMNKSIATSGEVNNLPNDLMDERDNLIDELTKLINIQYYENADHSVNVTLEGRALVDGTLHTELAAQNDIVNDQKMVYVMWSDSQQRINIANGELKGLFDIRDITINDYIERLDNLAMTMIEDVNRIHVSGYGLNGEGDKRFFSLAATGAGDFRLSEDILNDVNNIATGASDAPGDNSVAKMIYDLRDMLLMENDTLTLEQYYGNLISDIGSDTQQAIFSNNSQELIVQKLQNHRQDMMGVSIDDEMVDLIKSQTAYQAAAKIVTISDELMQTVLNMI